jgi:DNA segregation ATPase FtsK/SpoIIIE, S-DNA-T family
MIQYCHSMAKKKSKPKEEEPKEEKEYSLGRGILAIVIFIISIIFALSLFHQAGPVGIILDKKFLSIAFGNVKFITPFILIIFSILLIKDRTDDYRSTHGLGAILFFISISGLFHISYPVEHMWTSALLGQGGGALGMVGWVLKSYLGVIASIVILIGLLLISILLIFNTLIVKFFVLNNQLFSHIGKFGRSILSLFVKNEELRIEFEKKNLEAERSYGSLDDDTHGKDSSEDEPLEDRELHDESRRPSQSKKYEEDEHDEDTHSKLDSSDAASWTKKVIIKDLPPLSILTTKKTKPTSGDISSNSEIIRNTFAEFKIDVNMGEVKVGPTITQFTLKPPRGTRLTKITSLSNDLALALAAHPIRIEAPIPGKSLVGIEVPNEKTALVTFKELLESSEFKTRKHNMMIGLGKDVAGKIWFADLPSMPHLLVAGATGSGKTVCINTIILSLLYQNTAETLRFIMVDPKRVELTLYNGIPHLLTPVITNTQQTVNALKWTIGEMERRFEVLQSAGNRDITTYNIKYPHSKMPHLVFVIDELADLMATAANEVEAGIIRLAQMARAVGIHLVVATQRPSVDVITGLMKANVPGRIAFSVASAIDSRTILDSSGAEKLLGRGDMLLSTAAISKPIRIQGAFVSEEELKAVIEYLQGDEVPDYDESIVSKQVGGTTNMFGGANDDQDPLFEEAKREVIAASKASASFLQRKLRLGYARAARVLDELEAAGIIGPSNGSKPREILVTETEIDDTIGTSGLNVFDNTPDDTAEVDDMIEEEDNDDDDLSAVFTYDDEETDSTTSDESTHGEDDNKKFI